MRNNECNLMTVDQMIAFVEAILEDNGFWHQSTFAEQIVTDWIDGRNEFLPEVQEGIYEYAEQLIADEDLLNMIVEEIEEDEAAG